MLARSALLVLLLAGALVPGARAAGRGLTGAAAAGSVAGSAAAKGDTRRRLPPGPWPGAGGGAGGPGGFGDLGAPGGGALYNYNYNGYAGGAPGGFGGAPAGWSGAPGGFGGAAAEASSSAFSGGGPAAFGSVPAGGGWGGGGGGGAGSGPAARREVARAARQWRRYDRQYLRGLVPSGVPRPAGPAPALAPDAARFSGSLATADAGAAARGMLAGRPDAVAQGIVDASARGRRGRLAEAFADAAAQDRSALAGVLTRSADYALQAGQYGSLADATADAFAASKRRGAARPLGLALADAVSRSGDYGEYVYGSAIAKAIAAGGDGRSAVAEATAEVFCAGNQYASAWSNAFAIALNQDENGCLVLQQARALASASCGGGAFDSYSDGGATSQVLGFCGLFPPGMAPAFNFNSGDSGSNTWGGK